MNSSLVLDICERPKFSVFINQRVVYCGDFKDYDVASVIEECVDSFSISDVRVLIKPVTVDKEKYFALVEVAGGYVNVSIRDINAILEATKQAGISKITVCSYLSYYNLMQKGRSIVLDYTYDDKLLAAVYVDSTLKALHIGQPNEIESILKEHYKVEEDNKFTLINARSFDMGSYYQQLVCDYSPSDDKVLSLASPSIFAFMDTTGVQVSSFIEQKTQPNKPNQKLPVEPVRKATVKQTAPKQKNTGKKSMQYHKVQPQKQVKKGKVEKEVKQRKTSTSPGIFYLFLCIVAGMMLAFARESPTDLAGLHDYMYVGSKQAEFYDGLLETSNRVSKTVETNNAKLSSIYSTIKNCPINGIIGKIDVVGDNVDIEFYLNDTGSMGSLQSHLGGVLNIINTQDRGTVNVGDKTMFKVAVTGQIIY